MMKYEILLGAINRRFGQESELDNMLKKIY